MNSTDRQRAGGRQREGSYPRFGFILATALMGVAIIAMTPALTAQATTYHAVAVSGGAAATAVADNNRPLTLTQSAAATPMATGSATLNPLDLLVKGGLVLGLLVVTMRVLKAVYTRHDSAAAVPRGGLTIFTESVGVNQRLLVLDIGTRVLVVGATATAFTVLAEASDAHEAAALRDHYSGLQTDTPSPFGNVLSGVLTRNATTARARTAGSLVGESVRAIQALRREVDRS